MSIMQLLVLILLSPDISTVTSTLYPPGSRYPPKMQIFPCETLRGDSCESDLIIITAHRSMWLSLCEKHVRYNQHRKQNRWCQTACVDSLFPFKTTSCITHIQIIRSSKLQICETRRSKDLLLVKTPPVCDPADSGSQCFTCCRKHQIYRVWCKSRICF